MTFESIVKSLSLADQKIIQEVMALFETVDRRTQAFCRQTGLKCKEGCGACCENPQVESTVTEVLPLAVYLWSQGQALDTLKEIRARESQGPCVLYEPHAFNHHRGRCTIYVYRPGLCRLFGFAVRKNKYGEQELMTCKVIKEEQPGICERTEEKLRKGLEGPLLTSHAFDVANIDPAHGRAFLPINEALAQAIERIGYALEKAKQ
ncbi:MAG: YkgJ family cysteine cluster protein [Candidatus Omnitrophica bacterium]|nr:YkgJ family cysteine cluster protein [Candidatus Omnitrophota bacterium]